MKEWKISEKTEGASSRMHLAALFTALFLFDLDMTGRHLKLKTPNTLYSQASRSKKTKCCWLIMSPKKKQISRIFWIRKNKQRLTCKNIFYDRKYLKKDNISAMYKNINNIFIYIYLYIYFLSSIPTKIRSSYWSIWGTRSPTCFWKQFKYPSAVNVNSKENKEKKRKRRK